MKKTSILSGLALGLVIGTSIPAAKAQSNESKTVNLVGTTWRIVQNLTGSTPSGRTLYFNKNLTFESRNSNGATFNSGKYRVFDNNTFVTIHDGLRSANLYTFTIQNDTLHFWGDFLQRSAGTDHQISCMPVDEIWVRANDIAEENNGIKFSEDSLLSTALDKSAKAGKLIFMDCYTKWCGPCRYLASHIFPLKEAGDFYNQNFINLSFDMETPEGRLIAKKYGVRAYPTLLFLNAKGEVEHMSIGCGGVEHLLSLGKVAMDSNNNLKALQQKINNGDRSAETLTNYLSANRYSSDKKSLLDEYFKNKTLEQRLSEGSWQLYRWFVNDLDNPQFKFFVKHHGEYEKKFGKKEVTDKIMSLLDANMQDSVKYISLRKVDPKLFAKHKTFAEFRMAYYKARSQKNELNSWNKLMQKAKLYLAQDSISPYDYNDISWYVYENYKTFNDKNALQQAKAWSFKSYQLKPEEIQINDTYAHILFELGFIQEAIKLEEFALKRGQEEKSDSVNFFADELAKFKKALN
ncbi:MAG: thioredoxin family protein [Bacteroidota bacterium]|nr:thioredoxin family protein [Bacteroidota bacterium]